MQREFPSRYETKNEKSYVSPSQKHLATVHVFASLSVLQLA